MIVISNNFGKINCIKLTRHAISKLKILKIFNKTLNIYKISYPHGGGGGGGHKHFFTEK